MKIGNGFVTNSSSTSFVITSKDGLDKEKFLNAFGVSEESLLVDMYKNLYKAICSNIKPIPQGISISEYLKEKQICIDDEEDIKEIERRYAQGDTVYWGELSDSGDDGGLSESFFSHESFVVIGDDIYFNARNSVY
ncbi:MAG: hypothetical protein UGF89_06070 [Acutalibacteraceae bacterium]|nr:hypothetical protein [Acutalibacteraceae bacterium]